MRPFYLFLVASSFVTNAYPQSAIEAPVLGFAYDAARSAIRPLRGILGAAILGTPVDTGFALASAAISPRQDYALALSSESGELHLVRLDGRLPSVSALAGAIAAPDRVAFSPSGSAAVLYSRASGRFQLIAGLPDSPAVRDLMPGPLEGPVSAAAVSDDAGVVLIAAGGVRSIGPELHSIPLPLPEGVAALAFRHGSRDLLAATASGDLYLARNIDSNPEFRQVYAGGAGAAAPLAVRFAPGGTNAYVVDTKGTIGVVDLAGGATATLSCGCAPVGLEPLRSPTVFRLNDISGSPLLLFDAAGPRVWFIPADRNLAGRPRRRS